jgi:hypothetical protein
LSGKWDAKSSRYAWSVLLIFWRNRDESSSERLHNVLNGTVREACYKGFGTTKSSSDDGINGPVCGSLVGIALVKPVV